METLTIFTDGGCRGNPGIGAWAFYCPELDIREYGFSKSTTNNKMELIAIREALRWVITLDTDKYNRIQIWTDSKYSVDIYNTYIWNWLKTNTLHTKKNWDIISDTVLLRRLLNKDEWSISFNHIRGHKSLEDFTTNYAKIYPDRDKAEFYWKGNFEVDGLVNVSMDLEESTEQDTISINKLEWWINKIDDVITSIHQRGTQFVANILFYKNYDEDSMCKLTDKITQLGSIFGYNDIIVESKFNEV